MGVELAEVEPLGGLPHREAPGLSGGLPVRAGDRNRGGIPPVCQVGLRDVNRLAAVHCHDRLIQRRTAGLQGQHSDRGLSPVAELSRNNGPLLRPGLRAGRRRHRSDDGFVLDGDDSGPGNGRALGVLTGHGDGDALAVDCIHGDGIGAVPVGGEHGLPRLYGEPGLRHAEHRVYGAGKGIRLAHIGVRQGPKHDLGEIDYAVSHLHAVRHRVELERIDVLVGDVVHAVGLVGSGIVFQVLAVLAVKLGRPALQRKAAVVLRQRPVGILRSLLLVESVVAGAVGTEVAVMGRLETVIVSVLLYREDPSAIGRRSFSVRELSRGASNGGASCVVILPGQHALGGVVIQHHLIAGSRERAAGRRDVSRNLIERLRKKALLVSRDGSIGTPIALFRIPLQVHTACRIFNVIAVLRRCVRDLPSGIYIIERRTGVACSHRQFLAISGRKSIRAVRINAHRPHIGRRKAGERPLRHRHICAHVIVPVVGRGKRLAIGRVINDNLVAVGQRPFRGGVRLLRLVGDQIELMGKKALLVSRDGSIGTPIALFRIPLQVHTACRIFNVIAVLRRCVRDLPSGIYIIERRTGVACSHRQFLAISGRKSIRAVRINAHRPHIGRRKAGERPLRHRHICAHVIVPVVGRGKRLAIGRVVNHYPGTIGQRALRFRIGVGRGVRLTGAFVQLI